MTRLAILMKSYRRKNKLRQEDLAKLLNYATITIRHIENGVYKPAKHTTRYIKMFLEKKGQ